MNVVSTGIPTLTIAQGNTTKRTIPYPIQSIETELNTVNLWAGLTWSVETSSSRATYEFIGRNDVDQVKLNLGIQTNEASFAISVSNGIDSSSIPVQMMESVDGILFHPGQKVARAATKVCFALAQVARMGHPFIEACGWRSVHHI